MTASLRRSGGPATPPQLPIAHKLTDDTPIGYPIDIDGGTYQSDRRSVAIALYR